MPKIDNMLAILWMLRSGEKVTAKQMSVKVGTVLKGVNRKFCAQKDPTRVII
jgi:hypothetical protein